MMLWVVVDALTRTPIDAAYGLDQAMMRAKRAIAAGAKVEVMTRGDFKALKKPALVK